MKARIVNRIKESERPDWSPAKLDDVSAKVVENFFEPNSPYLTLAPELTIPADLTSGTLNPVKYALPSEEEIGSEVNLYDNGIQFEKLLQKFTEQRPGKLGVKEKIYEVVQRRCELTGNRNGNKIWLKWKELPKEVLPSAGV